MTRLLSPEELEQSLRAIGAERYHNRHAFHRLMVDGALTKGQLQAWALNRYYYQSRIPMKDATILARMDDPALRRIWRQRIIDHDGDAEGQGGIEKWIALATGLGIPRADVTGLKGVLPATRFAVDAYVRFCAERPMLEAIASSLTELFSPTAIGERVKGLLSSYDFVSPETLSYFEPRLTQAPRDADFALDYVKEHAKTPEDQRAVQEALVFKCHVLWSMLDALHFAYVEPGLRPPDAFVPEGP
ncbi:Coenzyme PQQ synthesis protein C [Lutibaculum baratangense AMV1]|uniref:Pyrroloquinoline-quinone synthase n=1 Tax=Lutibaculum baratangense AMV1 TaxID=631454 RepID=V4RI45_9HYPH|nr:pyrroloquinoline-quinone synthase PqqC [Lutibaculum baratangense]ESR25811.1 Coenzyme PQQ synthesis protein C [Lutibaculum baratangense AMV1]